MVKIYGVKQDGADFYLEDGTTLVAVITYPQGVHDFDVAAARRARAWFEQLMKDWCLVAVFESSID